MSNGHTKTFVYTELPNGYYGWVDEETREMARDPDLLTVLYARGKEMFPGYEEQSRAQWESELQELNRLHSLSPKT
jgi:hypothetical protein